MSLTIVILRPIVAFQGRGLALQYPWRRPRLRKRSAGLLGSAGLWQLRGASCHARPAWAAPEPLRRGTRVSCCRARVSVRATGGLWVVRERVRGRGDHEGSRRLYRPEINGKTDYPWELFQDLVTSDDVAWYLTKREWLRLDPEQRALAYYGNVTSLGIPVLNTALVYHLAQGQVLLVSDISIDMEPAKYSENTLVAQHQTKREGTQPQEMASTSSLRATEPTPEVKQNGDSEGRGGSPQNLPIEHHFACKECGDTFRLKVLLVQHQRVHSEKKGWECSDCGKVFRGVSEFNEHRKSHVTAEPRPGPSQALEGAGEKRGQMELEVKPFECEECGKRFKKNAGLSQHLRVHSREKPFDCEECGRSFKVNTHLFRHQKIHNAEKLFACKTCSRDFLDRQELLKHQRVHTGHLPFDCDDCGKSFRGVNGLAEHQRIHSGAKPYGCPHCGKLFRRSSELTKHRRIHTGEKPYACGQCGKAFRQSSSLLEHARIHSGERPYACGECGKAFRGPSDLIKHRRIHSGLKPYACDKCGKAFRRSSGLSRHRRIHSGARCCECSECGRVFKRRSALQKHQPTHQE
ncbi:zinc finger protein 275 [Otolemur garnettii]|uniref:zinc finger protein 275 n=1 Tax=Otolemur garnettii TaxID=30611 RepID=UPI000C7EE0B7|nr:zinc finger protein 275 [Otolemur garnettii]